MTAGCAAKLCRPAKILLPAAAMVKIAILAEFNYEDLELHYPALRFKSGEWALRVDSALVHC